MKIIFISSLSVISLVGFSQQQQQQIILTNVGLSNTNIQGRGNVLINSNQNFIIPINRNVIQAQRLVRNTANVRPARKYTSVKTPNTNKMPARRHARPRPIQVVQANVPVNEVLTASNSNPAIINNSFINPQVQNINLINNDDVQSLNESKVPYQGADSYNQQSSFNGGSQINFKVDLSLNLRGKTATRSSGGASSSSSHSKMHMFSKKFAKFKRHFFGKISSHKKGKHSLDVCFNWKK